MAANLGNVIAEGAKKAVKGADAVNKAAPGTLQALFGSLLSLFPGHTILGSVGRSMTGAGLTGAEIQANQFNAEQAQLAYERELSADSTKYQRSVADMKAAGLNPMLAAGSTGGSVNSSAASSVSPGAPNLSALFDMAMASEQLKIQRDLADAEIKNKDADTNKKRSETLGQDIQNEVNAATKQAKAEAAFLDNQLNRVRVAEVKKKLDEIDANITHLRAQAKSEEEHQSLMAAQRMLAEANAYQIVEMLPYQKMVASAKSEADRQAALLSAAHTAYQNSLLTDGYIDAFIRSAQADADSAEAKSAREQITTAIRTGDYSKTGDLYLGPAKGIMQGLTLLLDNINPLNNLLK